MAEALCSECVEDIFLREIVCAEGTAGHCDACEHDRPSTVTIDRLGELLEPKIEKYYRQYSPYSLFWKQEGDSLDSVVEKVLGQHFDFNDQIVDAVIAAENCDEREGGIPSFKRATNYVAIPTSGDLQFRWSYAKYELKTTRRFFYTRSPTA